MSGARDSYETALRAVVAANERFNRGDFEGFYGLIDDEIFCATDPAWPDGGEFAGKEAFCRFFDQFIEAFESVEFEPLSAPESVGDMVMIDARWVGSGRASGIAEPGARFTVFSATRGGRIVELRYFFDAAEADDFRRDVTAA